MKQNNWDHVLKIGYFNIEKYNSEKLLGINCDCRLKFNTHIEDVCKKGLRKFSLQEKIRELNALSRIVPCTGLLKRRALINAVIKV